MGRRFLPGVIKSLVLGDHFAIQEIRGIGASFGTSGEGTNLNQHVSTATGNIIIDIVMYFSRIYSLKKLDDGWPESVEEQGLLLLVWRDHITKQYIKDVL